MKPAQKNFISGNNETLKGAVRLFLPSGTGYDLTVFTALQMQVRETEFTTVALIDLTLAAGLSVYASAGQAVVNVIEFSASLADFPDIEFALGEHVYDVVGTRANGDRNRILIGTIDFRQGKTYDLPA